MDAETREMFQAILAGMESMEKRLNQNLEDRTDNLLEVIQQQADTLQGMIGDSEQRMKIYIENDVGKRIDSLFDGYKLTHEKQWELERKVDQLEKRLEALESRAG